MATQVGQGGRWSGNATLSEEQRGTLKEAMEMIRVNTWLVKGRDKDDKPIVRMMSDASGFAWGVVAQSGLVRNGQFDATTAALPIYYKEMLAIIRAIELAPDGCQLRLGVDNMAAVQSHRKRWSKTAMGRSLIERAEQIARSKNMTYRVAWISGKMNAADRPSRETGIATSEDGGNTQSQERWRWDILDEDRATMVSFNGTWDLPDFDIATEQAWREALKAG
jgi:hypothetical protein